MSTYRIRGSGSVSKLYFFPEINEKKKLFSECDIFILPSEDEADSVAIKEALSAGLPVIISKNCKFQIKEKETKQFVKIIDNKYIGQYVDVILGFYKNRQSN